MAEGDGWCEMGWKGVGEEEIGEDREEREATRRGRQNGELEEGKIGKIGVERESSQEPTAMKAAHALLELPACSKQLHSYNNLPLCALPPYMYLQCSYHSARYTHNMHVYM